MIAVTCAECGQELDEPGALVFGPPVDGRVEKFHVCVACWRPLTGPVSVVLTAVVPEPVTWPSVMQRRRWLRRV